VEAFSPERLQALQPEFRRMLEQRGVEPHDIALAVQRVCEALRLTLSDPQGRWLLSADHAHAFSELPLTVPDGNRFRELVVDRTFVAVDGVRWVIDYKISTHEGGDLDAFLREEAERHREQLRGYRDALAALSDEPVRTALYFPLLAKFHEVTLDQRSQAS
jgi:hypothetical protein